MVYKHAYKEAMLRSQLAMPLKIKQKLTPLVQGPTWNLKHIVDALALILLQGTSQGQKHDQPIVLRDSDTHVDNSLM